MTLNNKKFIIFFFVVGALFAPIKSAAKSARIKDISFVRGVRENKLMGHGLVIGLAGTGDSASSLATRKAVANMTTRFGIPVAPKEVSFKNTASVIVTANLPPFAKNGDVLSARVSASGDASSLTGGTLLLTHLQAANGLIYAVAQGALSINGAESSGVLTVAHLYSGVQVERDVSPDIINDGFVHLQLQSPDFAVNEAIVSVINRYFQGAFASSKDISTVKVEVPVNYQDDLVRFLAELEKLKVKIDNKAIVVINESTGTVVMGGDVTINSITVAHKGITINIGKDEEKSPKQMASFPGSTVAEFVSVLNSMGVSPKDLIEIIQSVAQAGALNAQLKII